MKRMNLKELIDYLKENGFVELPNRGKGSHKIFKNSETGKQTTVPTNKKELKIGTLNAILEQAGLK